MEEIGAEFRSQPFFDWLVKERIKIDVEFHDSIATFQELVAFTGHLTGAQKTYWLLKYKK
jgi:hypothetical protein